MLTANQAKAQTYIRVRELCEPTLEIVFKAIEKAISRGENYFYLPIPAQPVVGWNTFLSHLKSYGYDAKTVTRYDNINGNSGSQTINPDNPKELYVSWSR